MAERNAGRALKRAEIEDRRRKVATLTLNKVHQTLIAERLGVAQSTVSRDLKTIEAGWREAARANLDALKARELAELDELEREIVRRTAAKSGLALRGISLRLRVKERRARLMGLDAPQGFKDETPREEGSWRVKLLEYIEKAEQDAPPVEDVFLEDLTPDEQVQVNLMLARAHDRKRAAQQEPALGAHGAPGGSDAQ